MLTLIPGKVKVVQLLLVISVRSKIQSAIGWLIAEEVAKGLQSWNLQKYDGNDGHNRDGQNHADNTP